MYGDWYCGGRGTGCGPNRMMGFGPSRSAGWGGRFGGYGYGPGGPTKSERKEWLEALRKHLEERLAEVNEELGTL